LKILLTGANGFVGSHVLDALVQGGLRVSLLLRRTSDTAFIDHHLKTADRRHEGQVSVSIGSIEDPASLPPALEGVSHVIHCAGRTKACDVQEFYATNQHGTRNIINAINARDGQVQRLLHVSSLAVTGPGTAASPATENSPSRPVSHYGRSKLAAEGEVLEKCKTDWVIVRPPAVYGPRDRGFLPMFQAVKSHLMPRTNASQQLSLVYVKDLAKAIAGVLPHPAASGRTYFAAAPEIVTARQMAEEIARCLGTWTVPVPLPAIALWPMCLGQELISRMTKKPRLLNLQKYAELRAPGWVCDSSRLAAETGFSCHTDLRAGVEETLAWYRDHHWL
jgi:nucleoside-diphosphate-sugar epimerase